MIRNLIYIFVFLTFSISYANPPNQFVGDSLKIDTSNNYIVRKPVPKIHEKYTGDEFNYKENIKDDTLNAWQRFKRWLVRLLIKFFSFDTPKDAVRAVAIFLKLLGISIILFVLYKIVLAYMNNNGNWIFGRKSDKLNINTIDLETDISQTDFNALVNEAFLKNDFRLAIRYYYLLTLQQLYKKDIIKWDSEKTNYDYYNEIKESKVKKQFKYISYIYDYCWYGEFDITETEFSTSKKAFNKLLSSL